MKFTRLRLSGFKSFVEPTELVIERGLTGVVGPNGCGKSNLLEALRWVMGESSYKNMRASGMDDVIFSGTSSRPARNMAEVMVTLDNSARSAPPQFNELDAIEISRRIEREAGSAYRINGRDVRARDVQLLFADVSTGARSPALVRQGQIGELINAKPQSRRRILEEAAGITGLHSRRHEAELKLKAAETNLQRLQDVVAQLEVQLQSLKRQARQAVRYKTVSADIRKFEAAGLYLSWLAAEETVETEQRHLDEITRVLAEHTRKLAECSRRREAASEHLPSLRENEAARSAAVQRMLVERQGIEDEESRAKARLEDVQTQIEQIEHDLQRERDTLKDTEAVLHDIEREEASHRELQAHDSESRALAEQALQLAADGLAKSQETADEAGSRLSELLALRDGLTRAAHTAGTREERLVGELAEVEQRKSGLRLGTDASDQAAALNRAIENASQTASRMEQLFNEAEAEARAARAAEEAIRQQFEDARRAVERIDTEIRTLRKLLVSAESKQWPPLFETIGVKPGFEAALGAALGDDLDVPAQEAAPVHWRGLPPIDEAAPLPSGAIPLSEFVSAPPALARRLSHTGVVERTAGRMLQDQLLAGQRLVSREGDLWRWDGYTANGDAPTAAARRLAERNRLAGLEKELQVQRAEADTLEVRARTVRQNLEAQAGKEKLQREAWRVAASALEAARNSLSQYERKNSERLQQTSALEEASRRLAAGLTEIREQLQRTHDELATLPDTDALQEELHELRDILNRERSHHGEARAQYDAVEREARQRRERLEAIARERVQWNERSRRSEQQIAELEQRAQNAQSTIEDLKTLPEKFEERRLRLLSTLSEAETSRNQASDALAAGEKTFREADSAQRQAQSELTETREAHARTGALVEAARTRSGDWQNRIAEVLSCAPADVSATAGFDPKKMPPVDEIEDKLFRLREERERLGAVNLRAEEESQAVQAQVDGLVKERDDLVQAIAKLRGGILSLNKEGRQRLLEAFDSVNRNFMSLFTTLFGGGKAELQLIESEDPLEAGLEILAHPPGKRPQVLSLLSGGEQALTALALIFAVFLTNPSPICVLDEVDAPLDDHNVERFCNLLDAMLERTDTRFLIITHHALTMARMHRLFGVTMMERGVSQLVSVDLETAEGLREAS